MVDQARAFTDAYGADLRRYLAWADLQSADDARVVEAILPETDDDAVRIMTVHASKGLEFPDRRAGRPQHRGPTPSAASTCCGGASGAEVKLVKGIDHRRVRRRWPTRESRIDEPTSRSACSTSPPPGPVTTSWSASTARRPRAATRQRLAPICAA